jgi:hypothetical protein
MSHAIAPGKSMFMTAFMLWMSGNDLAIFSIMMLGMAFSTPVKGLMNIAGHFERFSAEATGASTDVDITLPKLAYVGCQLAGLCLALYKCHAMQLLPTGEDDWLPAAHVREAVFSSTGSVW